MSFVLFEFVLTHLFDLLMLFYIMFKYIYKTRSMDQILCAGIRPSHA